jgi:1-deoxy-D-xylulose-5-phosphate synthase
MQEYLKGLFLPAIIFEELGFRYIGPIDGHDLEQLIATFRRTDHMTDRPLLFHVITKKGKGYGPAECNPESYHGVAKPGRKGTSFTGVFARTVVRAAERDPRIVVVTAAMKEGTGLTEFASRFPSRFFDVGIAEEHAVTFAAGLAKEGLRPFVAIYSTFLQRACDQIIHDVCLPSLPVRFFIDRAGIVGDDGPTHNGIFDISFLTMIPNMVLLSPKDENEFQHLVWSMASYDKGPIAIRYPRGGGPEVILDEAPAAVDFLRNETLADGKDAVVFATGPLVDKALKAAEALRASGEADAVVVNCRCIKPLDGASILGLSRRAKRVVTVEENVVRGGFGSAVNELLLREGVEGLRIANIGLPDRFLEVGGQEQIRSLNGLSEESIKAALLRLVRG